MTRVDNAPPEVIFSHRPHGAAREQATPGDGFELDVEPTFSLPRLATAPRSESTVLAYACSLSPGTPGPLDERYAAALDEACRDLHASAVTVPLGATRSATTTLAHAISIPPTTENRRRVVRRLKALLDICERPLFLENPPSLFEPWGTATALDFLVDVAADLGAKVALNLTHLLCAGAASALDELLEVLPAELVGAIRFTGAELVEGAVVPSRHLPVPASALERLSSVARFAPAFVVVQARPREGVDDDRIAACLRATWPGRVPHLEEG